MSERPLAKDIRLANVDEAWLRAWVDAGYMTVADFIAEMKRREAARKETWL